MMTTATSSESGYAAADGSTPLVELVDDGALAILTEIRDELRLIRVEMQLANGRLSSDVAMMVEQSSLETIQSIDVAFGLRGRVRKLLHIGAESLRKIIR